MIVLDTTVLVYAKGADHELREPCRDLVAAIADGRLEATTTVEVIQEFVHVRARCRDRSDAAGLGSAFAELLSPLIEVTGTDLERGLSLFASTDSLGAFDAVLASAAIARGAEALVSADAAFNGIESLRVIPPSRDGVADLIENV